jgi:uncharacterized membrane protein
MMKAILIALLLSPLSGFAHEGHKEALTVTAKAMAKNAVVAAEGVAKEGATAMGAAAQAVPKVDFKALFKASLSSHRHNKIVHFPIALGLVGMLLLLLSYRNKGLLPGARWVLFLAAVGGVLAIITGGMQEDSIESATMKQVLEIHAGQGWWITISLWLTWLLSFFGWSKKWLWIVMLICAMAIVSAGTLGGALAHMQF